MQREQAEQAMAGGFTQVRDARCVFRSLIRSRISAGAPANTCSLAALTRSENVAPLAGWINAFVP